MKRMTPWRKTPATPLASDRAYSADIPLYPAGPEQDRNVPAVANGTNSELSW